MALTGIDRGTRLRIAAHVAFTIVLALTALLLLTWLSERPGLRFRFDLTQDRSNSLDPVTMRVLQELPGEVTVDLFFRPDTFPFEATSYEAQQRMRFLAMLVRDWSEGRVTVEDHDLAARAEGGGRWEQRAAELGLDAVRPPGVAVVSHGNRRHVLHVRGDIAEIDPGNPNPNQFVPAHITSFRGEEELVSSLLKVTQGDRLHVYFAAGQGEPDIFGDDDFDLGRLFNLLVDDGFAVDRWHGEDSEGGKGGGPIPDDCAVLALIGSKVPYSEIEAGWIREYLERGGRVVVAPNQQARSEPNTLEALVAEYGIRVRPGIVARPIPSPTTGKPLYGDPRCAGWYLGPGGMRPPHEITRPLRLGNRNIFLVNARALERVDKPPGTQVLDLLSSDQHAWLDLPESSGLQTWNLDRGEEQGPFVVGMAAVFPGRIDSVGPRPPRERADERVEGRLVVIGSELAFASAAAIFPTNRDFVLNVFNWAASREFRVRISPRDPTARIIDLGDAGVRRGLAAVCLGALPGLLLIGGIVTAWRRRRG